MHYNIILISKNVHKKPCIFALLNFKLCRRGDMYTTDLQRVYFMFFMVCHGLSWFISGDVFFCFYTLFIVC